MRHKTRWLGALAFVAGAGHGATAAAAELCPEAQSILKGDPEIAQATKAALKVAGAGQDNECLYPAKLLRYGSIDVLMTLAGAPGTLCHVCAATLSAYVLRRRPDGFALVSRFANFAEAGTNGDPGKIQEVSFAKSDGFAVAHEASFQGYTSTLLDLYVFKSGKPVHIRPTLELSADNTGAVADDSKAITVTGAWAIGAGAPNEVAIDYKVTKGGQSSTSRATWKIEGSTLSLTSGRVPPEFTDASGN